MHLAGDDEVVILEGTAELVTDPSTRSLATVGRATRAKYPQYYGDEEPAVPAVLDAAPGDGVRVDALSGFPGATSPAGASD